MVDALFAACRLDAGRRGALGVGIGPGSVHGRAHRGRDGQGDRDRDGRRARRRDVARRRRVRGNRNEDDAVVSVLDAMKGEVYLQARWRGSLVIAPNNVAVADAASRLAGLACARIILVGESGAALDVSSLPFPTDAPRDGSA